MLEQGFRLAVVVILLAFAMPRLLLNVPMPCRSQSIGRHTVIWANKRGPVRNDVNLRVVLADTIHTSRQATMEKQLAQHALPQNVKPSGEKESEVVTRSKRFAPGGTGTGTWREREQTKGEGEIEGTPRTEFFTM